MLIRILYEKVAYYILYIIQDTIIEHPCYKLIILYNAGILILYILIHTINGDFVYGQVLELSMKPSTAKHNRSGEHRCERVDGAAEQRVPVEAVRETVVRRHYDVVPRA